MAGGDPRKGAPADGGEAAPAGRRPGRGWACGDRLDDRALPYAVAVSMVVWVDSQAGATAGRPSREKVS
jgi:hypothetical protein